MKINNIQPIDPEILMMQVFVPNPDILAILRIRLCHLGYSDQLRSLSEEFDLQKRINNYFATAIAVAMLGQYSLVNRTTMFALAKCCLVMRPAMPEETAGDLLNFGDQVIGEELSESSNSYVPFVTLLGKKYRYAGPPRTSAGVNVIRIIRCRCPNIEKIGEMKKEVDQVEDLGSFFSDSDDVIAQGPYAFIMASNGSVHIGAFCNIEKFRVDSLQFLGDMVFEDSKLLFYPGGKKENQIDFSESIYRE